MHTQPLPPRPMTQAELKAAREKAIQQVGQSRRVFCFLGSLTIVGSGFLVLEELPLPLRCGVLAVSGVVMFVLLQIATRQKGSHAERQLQEATMTSEEVDRIERYKKVPAIQSRLARIQSSGVPMLGQDLDDLLACVTELEVHADPEDVARRLFV